MTTITTSPRCNFAGAANRRDTPRIDAHLGTTMCGNDSEMNGTGTVLDLSIIGCQIEIERSSPITKASVMEVRIQVPDFGGSVILDEAVVQWISGKRMGLFFMSVRVAEADRLAWVIRRQLTKA